MARLTISIGLVLVALGVGGWLGTGRASVTALIPAFIGVVLAALGAVALKPGARKHAMHAAAVVALVGVVGSLMRPIRGMLGGGLEFTTPVILQLATGTLLVILLILMIRSFIAARRSA